MAISYILPFKLMLISTGVLSAAILLKFSVPSLADFAVYELPSIYNGVVSWLTPPYLYLVINFIIITIVASSKLQSRKDDDEIITPVQLQSTAVKSIEPDYPVAEFSYNGVVLLNDSRSFDVKEERLIDFKDAGAGVEENHADQIQDVTSSNKENEFVISKSTWNSVDIKDSTEYSPSSVKPPVSSRFVHRRNVRASPEARFSSGGKTVLGVSKPKKQDTLESTWKTITEGRAVPITRHLRKSDTWERDNQEKTPQKMMTKAETFNDRTNTRSRSPSPGTSGGSGKMKKEPSLSQDELTRRVEAFIKKFNEDMKLQRQESLNQYMEMINRGSH
ncbi:hypothetical protein ACJIZ3_007428 [Penstemon smallii]|uniref:DUF4408 domain-containing protein n=1 Tax=Penstemon smallii TaxID=265156 RepID=A0ABD3SAT2_9LAMI